MGEMDEHARIHVAGHRGLGTQRKLGAGSVTNHG